MVKSRMGTKSVILHSLSYELLLGYLEYGQRVLNVLKETNRSCSVFGDRFVHLREQAS